jgi:hypothetical protein
MRGPQRDSDSGVIRWVGDEPAQERLDRGEDLRAVLDVSVRNHRPPPGKSGDRYLAQLRVACAWRTQCRALTAFIPAAPRRRVAADGFEFGVTSPLGQGPVQPEESLQFVVSGIPAVRETCL